MVLLLIAFHSNDTRVGHTTCLLITGDLHIFVVLLLPQHTSLPLGLLERSQDLVQPTKLLDNRVSFESLLDNLGSGRRKVSEKIAERARVERT
jgi:hypothetical protein